LRIAVFEDEAAHNFEPLSFTRGAFDLKLGPLSFAERIKHHMKAERVDFLTRDYIADHIRAKTGAKANEPDALDDETLFVNGLLVFDQSLREMAKGIKPGTTVFKGDRLVMAKFGESPAIDAARLLTGAPGRQPLESLGSMALERREYEGDGLITNLWEIIERNTHQIAKDIATMPKTSQGRVSTKAVVVGNRRNLFVAKGSEIEPYVVLDVTEGPVYIGENSRICASSWIKGPVYIGSSTIIHPGSVIREGSNIGDVCKIGGEVEETIVHAYSNKQHVGFLGHAYVGEWVNLGAQTTNSDLKNDYSTVDLYVGGTFVDSGTQKLGSFIGDHSKTSVGCLLNTGTIVGVMCNVISSGDPSPKFIPSFCWYFRGRFSKGRGFRRMIETAREVMKRRDVTLTDEDVTLYQKIYDLTEEEREKLIKRSRAKRRERAEQA